MKRYQKHLLAAGVIAALTVGGFFTYIAKAGLPDGGHRRGMFLAKIAELGITADQKAEVKAILQKHKPTAVPLVKEFVADRRALRDLMHADSVDESAIRAQVDKLAKIGADLAIERAKIAQEMRHVLTPEQMEKLKDMRSELDAHIDQFLDQASRRISE